VVQKKSGAGTRMGWLQSTYLKIGLCVAAISVVVLTAWLIALDREVVNGFEAHLHRQPAIVYASRLTIRPGERFDPGQLNTRLERLGFQATTDEVRGPGEYQWMEPDLLQVTLRPSDALLPSEEAVSSAGRVITLTFRDGQITAVRASDQSLAAALLIGAEPLGVIAGAHRLSMRPVRLAETPPVLLFAILTMEDRRFWSHHGIDLRAIGRAALADWRAGRIVEGGSTLTQQLVKNLFLGHEQTLRRKATEAVMALLLEAHYSKQTIFEAYLNSIYFGQRTGAVGEGAQAVIGVGEAAEFYFGRTVSRLSVAEQALLAAMIKSPVRYAPGVAPRPGDGHHGDSIAGDDAGGDAKLRRDLVLRRLSDAGIIARAVSRAAEAEPITAAAPSALMQGSAPYVVDWITQLIEERTAADGRVGAAPPGSRIVTTIDPVLQQAAEAAVQDGLAQLDQQTASRHPDRVDQSGKAVPDEPLQAALVAIDPRTGAIKALVGGRDYRQSQFNRVVQARRQPGSLFKPVVYLAALERADDGSPPFTLASIVPDEPITLEAGGKAWTPKNIDLTYRGPVTFRQVAERSLNAATVQIAATVGFDRIVEMARLTGASGDHTLPALPSIALGALEASPLEMATAYATLANHGTRIEPSVVDVTVEPDRGTAVPWPAAAATSAVSPEAVYLVTSLLSGVIDRGTGRMVRALGFDRPAAGKTGTSSGLHDAWFAGYTPDLVALVWVGYDQPQSIGLTGARAALPIWTRFMQQAMEGEAVSSFTPPAGVVRRRIDPTSGTLASWKCADGVPEWFLTGTEPIDQCSGRGPIGIMRGWFSRARQWFTGSSEP
jgi:1A family penicillin-binding protein